MRFHFHIRDLEGRISDEEGSELPDIAAARDEARATARDLAMEDLRRGHGVVDRRIEITTGGRVIEILTARDITHHH